MPENKNRSDSDKETTERPIAQPEPALFPWGMLCLAALFDLIGVIPFVNIVTEIFAGLIIGFWQKVYAPKTDPILSFIVAKIIDIASFGILPSNIGVVVYAYVKKKIAARVSASLHTPAGLAAANRLLKENK